MKIKVFKFGDNNGNCDVMVMMMGAYCLEQYIINYDNEYKQQQSSFDLKKTSPFSRKSYGRSKKSR